MSNRRTKTAKSIEAVEPVVYIGPTIPGVVTANTIFSNGLSSELETAITKEPALGNLVVSTADLSGAIESIRKQEGATFAFYQKALEFKK